MKINLYKVKDFLYKYRVYITVLAVFVLLFFVVDAASALGWSDLNPVNWLKGAADSFIGALISIVVLILYYVFLTPVFWLIAATIWVLTEVASFQQFINVPAVIAGWTIMRDLVNMGFVLALIYISFLTIIGKRPNIGKDLVQLILAVIAVNFSRMVVGLFIDLSQIIMLTFVNGFRNIAGGNIINKLNLNHYLNDVGIKFDTENASKMFVKVTLGIVMGLFVLAILAMMTVYLIIRVVTLWILTIMSPMVALSYAPGADGVLKPFVSEWSKQFRDALMGGPFMAFFLWFSLTVIGTTGTAGALTTPPSGGMGESFKGDVDSAPLFTLIIGTALLYAGYKQSKTMAGAAGAVGGKVFGMAKSYAKGVGKLADTGTRWGSKAVFKRDLSYTGLKGAAKAKLSDMSAGMQDIDRRLDERAIRMTQKDIETKIQGGDPYKGKALQLKEFDVEGKGSDLKSLKDKDSRQIERSGVGLDKIKEGEDLRSLALGQFDMAEKGLAEAEGIKTQADAKQGSLENVFAAMDENEYNRIEEGSDGFAALSGLVEANVLSQEEANILADGDFNPDSRMFTDKETLSKRDDIKKKLSDSIAQGVSVAGQAVLGAQTDVQTKQENLKSFASQESMDKLDAAYESGDSSMIETALADVQSDFNLSDKEVKAIADQKSGSGERRKMKIERDSQLLSDAESGAKKAKQEMKYMVQKEVLKNRKTAGHRVLMNDVSERRTAMRKTFEAKYSDVDSVDEIAAHFKSGDLTSEETNYFLEKLDDKVGDALERAGYQANAGGYKALKAETMPYPKSVELQTAISASKAGTASKNQGDLVIEYLNKHSGKSDWDTTDIVSKKNKQTNASLASFTTLDPNGLHQYKSQAQQYTDIVKDYERGTIPAKSLTPFLIEKDDNGDQRLTKLGYAFVVTHKRELKKDAFSDEFGKGLMNAIRNDKPKVRSYLESLEGKGAIDGSVGEFGKVKIVEKEDDPDIGKIIDGKKIIYYNEKKPQLNDLQDVWNSVEIATSGVKANQRSVLLDKAADIVEG